MLPVCETALVAVLALAEVDPVFAHLSLLLDGVPFHEVLVVLLCLVLLLLPFERTGWELLQTVKSLLITHLSRNVRVEVRNAIDRRLPARQNFLV